MWENTSLERCMLNLIQNLDNDKYRVLSSIYAQMKQYLCENIYSEIKAIEPNLTDHSERHIKDVLEKAALLLEDDISKLNPIELYLLCVCILFHDVGNIFGRTNHNTNIGDVYNQARYNDGFKLAEGKHVAMIVKTHCGTSLDGSKDTLISLPQESFLFDHKINMRQLAAVLRLADELAEGTQRTSLFRLSQHMFAADSMRFHKYASITEIHVDKKGERIVIIYHIDYSDLEELYDFLPFVYTRILKLDAERRYCKYYAPFLTPFKKTEVQLNFYKGSTYVFYDTPKIELEDKYCLIEESPEILTQKYPCLEVKTLLQFLQKNN